MEKNITPIKISKTIEATGFETGEITIRRYWRIVDPCSEKKEDLLGEWWIEIIQPYRFVDSVGSAISGMQKQSKYRMAMPEEEFKESLPDIYKALAAIWMDAQSTIKKQEGLS